MKHRKWQVWIEFCQGICLPESKSYELKFVLGSHVIESGSAINKGDKYCRWDKRVYQEFEESYQSDKRFPTFFVYLMDGSHPICFFRDSVMNYSVPDAQVNWNELERDKSVGKVDESW